MKRRDFLVAAAAASASPWLSKLAEAEPRNAVIPRNYRNLLILVELKGGNDGLNTVIPYADPTYRALRKNIGIQREQMIPLNERTALHPSLQTLMPLWRDQQLAIIQGVGYDPPNLSHFRSMEIWDTASHSHEYLRKGWLTRAFEAVAVPSTFAASGMVIGSAEMGPFTRSAPVVRSSHSAMPVLPRERNAERKPIFKVESPVVMVAGRLWPAPNGVAGSGEDRLKTTFAPGALGASIRTAMWKLAACGLPQGRLDTGLGVAVIRLTLNGFDTHQNQPGQHAALLKQLADGLVSMRLALIELGRWDSALVMTYAEFGRRPRENESNGTDHGTVAAHFVMGARVRGGLYGVAPELGRLDGNGNLPLGVDFRRIYATVLGPWWGLDAKTTLGQRFEPLPLLRI